MRKILLVSALVFFSRSLFAQRFDTVLNLLDTKYPQEKLYLQFDKNIYNPGETIWFKAYLFSGVFPSLISKTVYAELLDEQGKLLDRKSAPVIMSGAAAAFDLPAGLKAQTVYVRAYTRWMLNFDSSFLYVKAIPIANKLKPAFAGTSTSFLQFFPEGGNMIAGVECKVAYKATDNKGMPVPVKGVVISSTGKRISSFSSMHDGMGYFFMNPVPGEQYTAKWTDQSGEQHETALPAYQPEGVMLSVENNGDKLKYLIVKSPGYKAGEVHVVAQLQQQLLYRAKANIAGNPAVSGSIPLKDVPAGITQITLFDEKERPLAERLCFVNQGDYSFTGDMKASAKDLAKRAKNVIEIEIPDTFACNLSIAVTDAALNSRQENEDDIFSHLLLTSDIKGYVHDPGYYFSGADSAAAYLDLVMLTNGWRRFRWEDALAGKFPGLKQEPEDYLAIKGKVAGLNSKQLAQHPLSLVIESKNHSRNFLNVPLQADGTFTIEEVLLYDTVYLHYKLNNDKDRTLTSRGTFEFRNSLLNDPLQIKPGVMVPSKPDTALAMKNAGIAERQISDPKVKTLATVEVTAKQKTRAEKIEEEYTSGLFTGQGSTFVMDNDPVAQQSLDIFHYLVGRVAGLRVTFRGKAPLVTFGRDQNDSPPVFFLNEMVMEQGAADLLNIPMSDVALIKVYNPPFLAAPGGSGAGGAIAVYTKKGSTSLQEIKGLDVTSIMGYSPLREFYSPDYSKYDSTTTADYRTTLYWDPFVFTDKENKRIVITFYNNDITNRMRLVMEGINTNGKLTHLEKIIE